MNSWNDIEEFIKTRIFSKLDNRLDVCSEFLEYLNNPQQDYNVIHVAGTSGKGTVCMILSKQLTLNHVSNGLLLSPHVYDLRERFQIDS